MRHAEVLWSRPISCRSVGSVWDFLSAIVDAHAHGCSRSSPASCPRSGRRRATLALSRRPPLRNLCAPRRPSGRHPSSIRPSSLSPPTTRSCRFPRCLKRPAHERCSAATVTVRTGDVYRPRLAEPIGIDGGQPNGHNRGTLPARPPWRSIAGRRDARRGSTAP